MAATAGPASSAASKPTGPSIGIPNNYHYKKNQELITTFVWIQDELKME